MQSFCECTQVTGRFCPWKGDLKDTVRIVYKPDGNGFTGQKGGMILTVNRAHCLPTLLTSYPKQIKVES
jgi:hypothetical protein